MSNRLFEGINQMFKKVHSSFFCNSSYERDHALKHNLYSEHIYSKSCYAKFVSASLFLKVTVVGVIDKIYEKQREKSETIIRQRNKLSVFKNTRFIMKTEKQVEKHISVKYKL